MAAREARSGVALLHVLPGMLYVGLGPLQFVARLRAGLAFEDVFGASFWVGLGASLAVAEAWIRHTRART